MKYSFSEPLNRNIMRHLRFQYPTFMLSTPQFEIDEEGQPWWIAPPDHQDHRPVRRHQHQGRCTVQRHHRREPVL